MVVNEIHYIEYSNVLNNVNVYIVVFPDIVLSFHPAPIQATHEVSLFYSLFLILFSFLSLFIYIYIYIY